MKNRIGSVRASARELRSVQALSVCGMLLALKIVLGFFSIDVSQFLKIGFSFLPVAVTGMLFGPVAAGIVGASGDIISYVIHSTGPYFPGFTLNAFASGFLYGLFLYRRPVRFGRAFAAKASVTALVGLTLNPLWLSVLYGRAFWAVFTARVATNIVQLPVDAVLLFLTLRLMERVRFRAFEK